MVYNAEPPIQISGIRKAAILMIILGEAASAEVLREMDEDEVQLIGREVARISAITTEQSETVLEQYYQMSMAHNQVLKSGMEYARKSLISAFGPEHAQKLLDRLAKALSSDSASFDTLQKIDPQQLAK